MAKGLVILLVLISALLSPFFVSFPTQVSAKEEEPIGQCYPFFKDGALLVTRCVDTEMDIVCYINNYGFEVCEPL